MKLQTALYTLIMSILSVILSVTTVFLAPLPLLVLRRNFGRGEMIAAAALGGASLGAFAPQAVLVSYLAAVIVAFFLSECENLNVSYTFSVFITVFALVGAGLFVASVASKVQGFNLVGFFRDQITLSLSQIKLPPEVQVDKETLLKQVPSALFIMMIFTVWINSVLVRRVERALGWIPAKQKHFFPRSEFYKWRLPDEFVWVALLSAAGNFLAKEPQWLKWTSANIFNIVVMLYFFQGLAVVVSFLNAKKITAFWRTLVYLLIFTQLFLGVAFLGFVDLWMDFRNKTKAKKSPVI